MWQIVRAETFPARIFRKYCAGLHASEINSLVTGGCYDRLLVFDYHSHSVRAATRSDVPWHLAFWLSHYHRKCRFLGKGLPRLKDINARITELTHKFSWRWHFRQNPSNDVTIGRWPSVRPYVGPRVPVEVSAVLNRFRDGLLSR